MAGTIGRPNPLNSWSTYDWANEFKYTTTIFTALTFTGQTAKTAQTTVTATGVMASGSKVGLMYGQGGGSGGYHSKTLLQNGPGPVTIKLSDLKPGTVYNCAAYGIASDGSSWIGPNALLTTTAAVDPLPIAGYTELEGQEGGA